MDFLLIFTEVFVDQPLELSESGSTRTQRQQKARFRSFHPTKDNNVERLSIK
jgi:hypothetical protein